MFVGEVSRVEPRSGYAVAHLGEAVEAQQALEVLERRSVEEDARVEVAVAVCAPRAQGVENSRRTEWMG